MQNKSSIPVDWHSGSATDADGNPSAPVVAKTTAPIVTPSEKDVAIFSDQRVTTCGSCKHFKYALAQKDFERSRWEWVKALTDKKQYDWKLRHLPDNPRRLAICGQKDDTVVSAYSKSCEYYKRNGI